MVDPTPAAPDSTILDTPPAAPKTPESTLYDKPATPPAAATPAPTAPVTPPSGTPPPSAPSEPPKAGDPPVPPQEPPKTGEPKTPPAAGDTPPADYDLKLPEGSPLSADDLAATLKDAKATGLTKEQAEKTLETKDQAARAVLQRQKSTWETQRAQWKPVIEKDAEIGGEKLSENMELAKRAWDKLASPELKFLCSATQTGLGDHPELVRLMVRVGRLMAEDSLVRGTPGAAPRGKNPEDILYGSPKSPAAPMA